MDGENFKLPDRKLIVSLGMQSLVLLIFHHFFQENMSQVLSNLEMPNAFRFTMTWTAGIAAPLLLNSLIFQRFHIFHKIYGNSSMPKG